MCSITCPTISVLLSARLWKVISPCADFQMALLRMSVGLKLGGYSWEATVARLLILTPEDHSHVEGATIWESMVGCNLRGYNLEG